MDMVEIEFLRIMRVSGQEILDFELLIFKVEPDGFLTVLTSL